MSVMAPPADLQLDFWMIPEPQPATAPAEAAIVSGQRMGGERTLEDLILGAWEELAAHRLVQCPVCAGVMASSAGAHHARPVGATCRDCGSRLS
jgi:hypothetical protein